MDLVIDPQLRVPKYPKIPEDCHVVFSDNNVQIYGMEESISLSGNKSLPYLMKMIPLLNGKNSIEDILKSFKENEKKYIGKILGYLYMKGVFESFDNQFVLSDDSNDLRFYSRCADITRYSKNRFEVMNRIKGYRLCLLANGEFGECLLNELETAGFEDLRLFHFDKKLLDSLSDDKNAIERLIDENQMQGRHVVVLADRKIPHLFKSVNNYCLENKTTWTLSYLTDKSCLIGPTFIPGETGCYNCYEQRMQAYVADIDDFIARNNYLDMSSTLPFSHTTYNLKIWTSMVVSEIVNISSLINFPQTIGGELEYNFVLTRLRTSSFYALPSCKACSKKLNSEAYQYGGITADVQNR